MVPTTLGAVVVFLLLIAPGLAFELLRQRARPVRPDSAFVEISRVLLTGTTITIGVLALLGLVRLVNPTALADPAAWVRTGNAYVAAHLPLLLWSAAAHLVLALLLAVVVHVVVGVPRGAITADSSWHVLFRRLAPEGTRPFLSVQLKDGTTYTGYRAEYTTEPEPAKRDLALAPPIAVRRPGSSETTALPGDWQRLWIKGDEIATFAVSYVGKPPPQPSRRKAELLRHKPKVLRHTGSLAGAAAVVFLVALMVV